MCDVREMWIGGLCRRSADFRAGGSALEYASGTRSSGLNFRGDSERCRFIWMVWYTVAWKKRSVDSIRPSGLGGKKSRERDLRRAHVKIQLALRHGRSRPPCRASSRSPFLSSTYRCARGSWSCRLADSSASWALGRLCEGWWAQPLIVGTPSKDLAIRAGVALDPICSVKSWKISAIDHKQSARIAFSVALKSVFTSLTKGSPLAKQRASNLAQKISQLRRA